MINPGGYSIVINERLKCPAANTLKLHNAASGGIQHTVHQHKTLTEPYFKENVDQNEPVWSAHWLSPANRFEPLQADQTLEHRV